MNAMSDPMLKHLNHYVLAYPIGHTPAGVEPSSEFCQFEEYYLEFSAIAPCIGDKEIIDKIEWQIAELQSYQSTEGDRQVHVAICTQDGTVPVRDDWYGDRPTLYVPALVSGELALNEDGSSHYGMVDAIRHIPKINIFKDWRFQHIEWFEPMNTPGVQVFQGIALCWCNQATAIAA